MKKRENGRKVVSTGDAIYLYPSGQNRSMVLAFDVADCGLCNYLSIEEGFKAKYGREEADRMANLYYLRGYLSHLRPRYPASGKRYPLLGLSGRARRSAGRFTSTIYFVSP